MVKNIKSPEKGEPRYTPESLPIAVKKLFEMNGYIVEGHRFIHGAEVDLIAKSKLDPFASTIYIEVTTEYVRNTKYGKDLTKFSLLRERERDCHCLIVSSEGFSADVVERASITKIETLTYDELFKRFEKFESYISSILMDGLTADELRHLAEVYEEPCFIDNYGQDVATKYLNEWKERQDTNKQWIIIVGDYGTGKTALTKILQYRWMLEYVNDPSKPLPIRVELRDFTHQFNANTLLHQFMDSNGLSDIPMNFFWHLIREGRIILLLDGYDEMAQYMHARERRACLEALAELSSAGVKGILTSRPNYFSEAEEFQLFEVLYKATSREAWFNQEDSMRALQHEKALDDLLTSQFLYRNERILNDLDSEQTEKLITRSLNGDPEGQEIVIHLVQRIFRSRGEVEATSLSGKPVIITYLLEVVEQLKESKHEDAFAQRISEWGIYDLILKKLMIRDYRRSPELFPDQRRGFLRDLALWLSVRGNQLIDENDFRNLIENLFSQILKRLPPDRRKEEADKYFVDLRSSSTLTRRVINRKDGWCFSHNSLREFLTAESLILSLDHGTFVQNDLPVSDSMKSFVASMDKDSIIDKLKRFGKLERTSSNRQSLGVLLNLLWNAGLSHQPSDEQSVSNLINFVTEGRCKLLGFSLSRLTLSTEGKPQDLHKINFSSSQLSNIKFSFAILEGSTFENSLLEEINFYSSNIKNVNFKKCMLLDIDITDAEIKGANFSEIKTSEISIIVNRDEDSHGIRIEGLDAFGYLKYHGAITSEVPPYYVVKHHPNFDIVNKVFSKLGEQASRQFSGLTQRGEARKDPKFARDLIDVLTHNGFTQKNKGHGELVVPTPSGREMLSKFFEHNILPESVIELLS